MSKPEPAHADASPSAASIWLKCPASVTKARGRQRLPTIYTREGSAAHAVAEQLVMGLPPPKKVEIEGETIEVDDDMIEAVEVYADYVRKLAAKADYYVTEAKVVLNGLAEPLSGTADFLAWTGDTLDVVDLKYGKGVPVGVVDNPQLSIYALAAGSPPGVAAVVTEPPKHINLTVVQPRGAGPALQSHHMTVQELIDFKKKVLAPALKLIAKNDRTENPGEHCRWCVRAGECASLAKLAQDKARLTFADDPDDMVIATEMSASGLSDKDLADILDHAELIASWVERVRAEASQRIDHGKSIPGWKLVAKQARRKWVDADVAFDVLYNSFPNHFDDMVKLDTPTAVERVLKRAKAKTTILDVGGGLVSKESSGTTLARESDSRPAVKTDAKSVFEQFTESLEILDMGPGAL